MDKEMALLLPLLDNMREVELDSRKAFIGTVADNEVCVMKCGIGKVNAALNAYRMISAFSPDLVINSGVAGGADPSMKVGSLLVASEAAYHDVWCGPGTRLGQMDGMPSRFPMAEEVRNAVRSLAGNVSVREGLICTSDRFISTPEEVDAIKAIYSDALACDMESAAIAHVCHDCGVPFAVIRVVSDTPGQADNISQYENFWNEAPEKTFEAVKAVLNSLSSSRLS